MTTTETTYAPLAAGTKIVITKGCKARDITIRSRAVVKEVTPLGPDYSHSVKIVFTFIGGFLSGKSFAFYAKHPNRLADHEVGMHDGRPEHRILVRRAA